MSVVRVVVVVVVFVRACVCVWMRCRYVQLCVRFVVVFDSLVWMFASVQFSVFSFGCPCCWGAISCVLSFGWLTIRCAFWQCRCRCRCRRSGVCLDALSLRCSSMVSFHCRFRRFSLDVRFVTSFDILV